MVIAIVILIVITLVIPINYHSYSMVYNYPAKSLQSCNSPGTTAKRATATATARIFTSGGSGFSQGGRGWM